MLEFLTGLRNTLSVVRVDDEDDTLGILEVRFPVWPVLLRSSEVPRNEPKFLVFDSLDVESCGDVPLGSGREIGALTRKG